ncbi:hypothetical protein Tco_1191926 [Tanacetum coccineum]
MEVFAWEPADMIEVPRRIIKHSLNVNPSLEPFCQKRRTFSPEKSEAVTNKFSQKCDGIHGGRCIDFKILNSACPKDYYPLPGIDCKVEVVMGFKYKCFLDAYKGYSNSLDGKRRWEKTAFLHRQGTYFATWEEADFG